MIRLGVEVVREFQIVSLQPVVSGIGRGGVIVRDGCADEAAINLIAEPTEQLVALFLNGDCGGDGFAGEHKF